MQLGDSPIEKKARQAVGLPCFFSSTERLFHNRYLHQRLISDYADCNIHTVILIFFLVPLFSHKRALIEIKEQNFPPKRLCSCRRYGSKKEGIHQLLKTQRLSNGWRYGSGDQVQVKHCSHVTQKDESTLACLSFLPQIRQKKPLVWSGLGYHHC